MFAIMLNVEGMSLPSNYLGLPFHTLDSEVESFLESTKDVSMEEQEEIADLEDGLEECAISIRNGSILKRTAVSWREKLMLLRDMTYLCTSEPLLLAMEQQLDSTIHYIRENLFSEGGLIKLWIKGRQRNGTDPSLRLTQYSCSTKDVSVEEQEEIADLEDGLEECAISIQKGSILKRAAVSCRWKLMLLRDLLYLCTSEPLLLAMEQQLDSTIHYIRDNLFSEGGLIVDQRQTKKRHRSVSMVNTIQLPIRKRKKKDAPLSKSGIRRSRVTTKRKKNTQRFGN